MEETTNEKQATKDEIIIRNILRNRLNQYSQTKKIGQEECYNRFCESLQITRNQLTYWLRNTTQPTLAEGILIADFFQLPITKIFTVNKI